MKLRVNGASAEAASAGDTPLLWVLRDELGLTGSKYGCGRGLCGACTVLLDGMPVRACVTPLDAVGEREVTTIEGNPSTVLLALQRSWQALDVAQCGYCQSGQLMAASALLARNPSPSDTEITAAMDGNLCRCATYPQIRAAIRAAAEALA